MSEDKQSFEVNIDNEKEFIRTMLLIAISEAPPIKAFKDTLSKIRGGDYSYEQIRKLPGVLLYKEPHIYGLALTTLNKIAHGQIKKEVTEEFQHEMDHFNESKEHDIETVLGIALEVDGKKILSNGQISYKKLGWTAFTLSLYPGGITKDAKTLIQEQIYSAPEKPSPRDIQQLKIVQKSPNSFQRVH